MAATPRYWRGTLRNAADSADLLVVSSVPGGTNPYLSAPPQGSASSVDVVTGEARSGATTWTVLDPLLLGGGTYLVTSVLGEDVIGNVWVGAHAAAPGGPWASARGRVQAVEQVRANEYAVTVSDGHPAEHAAELFAAPSPRFPMITALIGGPVSGSGNRPELPDLGPWKYQVASTSGDAVQLGFREGWVNRPAEASFHNRVWTLKQKAEWKRAYRESRRAGTPPPPDIGPHADEPGTWQRVTGGLAKEDAFAVDQLADAYFVREDRHPAQFIRGSFRGGLLARVTVWATGAAVTGPEAGGRFVPLSHPIDSLIGVLYPRSFNRLGDLMLEWPAGVAAAQRVVGTYLGVVVEPLRPSREFPMWAYGHPVEVARDAYLDAGIPVVTASVTSTVAAVGPDLRVMLGYTDTATPAEVYGALAGPFSFLRRYSAADGDAVEFVPVRGARPAAAPATTITLGDLADDQAPIFRRSGDSVVNRVLVQQQGFEPLEPEPLPTEQAASVAKLGRKTVTFDLPGRVLFASGGPEDGGAAYYHGVAAELLRARLRGAPTGELHCIDTDAVAALREGDEVTLDLPHVVDLSAVPATKGGQRVVVVTSRTRVWEAGTVALGIEDAGEGAQLATAPTLSIAQDATDSRHVAVVTITNAGTLAAAGLFVRLEWTAGAGAPSGAGALLGVVDPASVTAVAVPAQNAGTTVQARAQSVVPASADDDTRRPSAFSAWASVALASIPAPSAFTATAVTGDGGRAVLAWTNGDATLPVEVRGRVTATEPTLKRFAVLPAGSDRYTATGLTAATGYTFDVRHVEAAPFGGASAGASATVTTNGTVPTLTTPPAPLVSSNGAGTVRVDATAANAPSTVVLQLADETAVGSGVAGAYSDVDSAPASVSDYTPFSRGVFAITGKKLFARVYETRAGATASAPSPAVSVDPWAVTSGGGGSMPTVPAPTIGATRTGGAGSALNVTGTPAGGTPTGTVFVVEDSPTGAGTYAENSGASDTSFPQLAVVAANSDVRVRADRAGYLSSYSNVVVNV